MSTLVHILHIEDDDIDAENVLRSLHPHNLVKIIRAATGEQAFNILHGIDPQLQLQRPFLILSDLWLPGMSGIEFLARLRSEPELADTKVIVISSSESSEHRKHVLKHQVIAYVKKSQLTEGIDRLVALLLHYLHRRVLRGKGK